MNKSGFRLLNLASFAPDWFKSQFSISLSREFSEMQAIRTMPSTRSCFLIMAHRKATALMTLCFTTLTSSLSLYSMATALVFANSCSITNTRVINRSFKLLPSLVSLMVSRQVIMTPECWHRPRSTPQPQVDSGPISTVRSMGSFKCPRRMSTTLWGHHFWSISTGLLCARESSRDLTWLDCHKRSRLRLVSPDLMAWALTPISPMVLKIHGSGPRSEM
jgi:hypothetical protein